MTSEEIREYKNELWKIVKNFNERVSDLTDKELYDKRSSIYKQIISLADKVGASKCIGAGYFNIEKSVRESPGDDLAVVSGALESMITEIIAGINDTLQTEAMLNACASAEQSSKTAKWSCFWAAIAAIASCISVLLVLFCA
ncbi:MAG: hypothetical protein ABSA64_05350 [Sedimentisphaerales bacterium]|jgi:hypothetical protein